MMEDPIGAVLRNQDKKRAAAQIIGQAYVTAYSLMASNREQVERIAKPTNGLPRPICGRMLCPPESGP